MGIFDGFYRLSERVEKLEKELNKLQAERKSLYELIDRLEACIDATNTRTDGETSQIEAVEDRLLTLEAFKDRVEETLFEVNRATEEIDGTSDG